MKKKPRSMFKLGFFCNFCCFFFFFPLVFSSIYMCVCVCVCVCVKRMQTTEQSDHQIHREFVPRSQTVNDKFYFNVSRRVREDIRRKLPELWREGNWMLHDDNAPSHRTLVTREFLGRNNVVTPTFLPYSLDDVAVEGSLCRHRGGYPVRIAEGAWHAWRTRLPKQNAFQQWQRLYRCTRGLMWRGWCPDLNKASILLYIGLVSEHFDTTSYLPITSWMT